MTTSTPAPAEELAPHACWTLLRQSPVGRLAVVHHGIPDIFPVTYVVDHGSIVFRTAAGTKLAAAKGRQVAFEADGYDLERGSAWSVVVKGKAMPIEETADAVAAMALPLYPWMEGNKPWFLRIVASSLTGRMIPVRGGARAAATAQAGTP